MRCGVLIPVYQPDEGLPRLISELLDSGMEVLVVNDGSTVNTHIFQQLEERQVAVLHHSENSGKGKALKTGIACMAQKGFQAVITADADGQHSITDIRRIARALEEHPTQLVLGARDIAQMIPRSRAGNSITQKLFRFLHGISLQDTQTGLRGIPLTAASMPGLLELTGDRYEYEMEMLLHSRTLFPDGILELPIQTIYLDQNQSSHFRPLADGSKIYRVLFRNLPRFLLSSLLSFALDYAAFNALYYFVFHTSVPATVIARTFSATVNFLVNRSLVFKGSGTDYTAWNYLKLALCILALNTALMHLLVDVLSLPAFVMKIVVECVLYLVSFIVQSRFASRKHK